MLEYGRVTKLDGGEATVSFARHGECDRCHICRVTADGADCELRMPNTCEAEEGDFVKVEIFKGSTRVLSVAVYLIALLFAAAGVIAGVVLSAGATAIFGSCGLVLGLGIAISIDLLVIRRKRGCLPEMKEVCTEAEYLKNGIMRQKCSDEVPKL